MIRLCQLISCLAAFIGVLTASAQPVVPPVPNSHNASAINLPMPPPVVSVQSPVSFFRQLLAMSPAERMNSLTNRSPEVRARILAKVRQYSVLAPDERELRLRSTELRWYLIPLFRLDPANRSARLDQVPADLRDLVKSRLDQWDLLPPPLQQKYLANEHTLPYFAHVETTNSSPLDPESVNIASQFNQFFELTPAEKQRALNTLSVTERAEMEKTLKSFEQLPPRQRMLCVRNYARFAGMNPAERADFLQNAGRWSKMSPSERQSWRDLVAEVPLWPTLPAPTVPQNLIPRPPSLKTNRPGVATN